MTQLAQSLGLDLTDALTGDVEVLADLFQRALVLPSSRPKRSCKTCSSRGVRVWSTSLQLLLEQGVGCGLCRSGGGRRPR